MAPGLVQVQKKFRDRNVLFVSLTNMERLSAESYVKSHGLPWPCCYGATNETISHLGAFNLNGAAPGDEVQPTLYLLGPDMKVLWHDGRARMRHAEVGPQLSALEAAITQALAKP